MMIIRVIDLETTGLEPPEHAVCEIGWCDLRMRPDLLGAPVVDGVIGGGFWLINPGRTIPPEASAVHHIIDDDVRDEQTWPDAEAIFTEHASQVVAFAAHNAKFERLWCSTYSRETPWICTYKCALRLWPDAPSHSNQALRYWRRPDGLERKVAEVTHRAYPDAYVTAFLLRDMLNEGATVTQMVQWSSEPALQVRCHIGKWRGTPWREVDDGFLSWVSQRDFDEDVLFTVRHELERREKERQAEVAA